MACGSRPLPDAVTRSTGIGRPLPGSPACRASILERTASRSAGLVGARFEPDDPDPFSGLKAVYGTGLVADGRPQKCPGSENSCPMSEEPAGPRSPDRSEPPAWRGNNVRAMPVMALRLPR